MEKLDIRNKADIDTSLPLISIVGRPNVGKSTLFNRLIGKRRAITDPTPGVTRDPIPERWLLGNNPVTLVDSGGVKLDKEGIDYAVSDKSLSLLPVSDAIIFLMDCMEVTREDQLLIDQLRPYSDKVVLAVNKVDSGVKMYDSYQFYSLGLGEVWSISAANGGGTGDLLDEITRKLPEDKSSEEDEHPDLPHIAIVGRPNVGKSSLTNALLGTERNIVTPVAGTTRDSIATYYNKFGHEFMLVDTAGMRKKTKVHEDLEFYSVMRSIRAIEHSDICILMIDAQTGMEAQDMSIFNLIVRNLKGCVIVVNKWDTVEKESNTLKRYEEALRARLAPFNDVPIIFTSVLKKQRLLDVLNAAARVYENYTKKIPTSKLNEEMLPLIEAYPPPSIKGKYIKIKYCMQLPNTQIPSFVFYANLPQYVKEPYKRFLENKIRERWNFSGTPINIFIRQK